MCTMRDFRYRWSRLSCENSINLRICKKIKGNVTKTGRIGVLKRFIFDFQVGRD